MILNCLSNSTESKAFDAADSLYLAVSWRKGETRLFAIANLLCHEQHNRIWMDFFGPLPYIPYLIALSHIIFLADHISDVKLKAATWFSFLVWAVSWLMQIIIGDPRPYPLCSCFVFSRYGLPLPDMAYFASLVTITVYRHVSANVKLSKVSWFSVALVIIIVVVYCVVYVKAMLGEVYQVIFSLLVGIVPTYLACFSFFHLGALDFVVAHKK